MEDGEEEEVERVRDWIERLEAFTVALDDVEGDNATDFANNALEALNDVVLPHLVPAKSPSMLLALEAVVAIAQAATVVIMDWADTPDVRDRYTRETAQPLFKTALNDVLSRCKSWPSDGLPPTEEVQQRIAAGAKEMQESQETLGRRNAELEAQDAEAEADPYGAILFHVDPSRSDAPIFEKVCSFTEDDHKRYRDAYERLRRMIDSELLQHIADEYDRFSVVLAGITDDLRTGAIGVFNEDAWDERRRKARSALISFTTALQVHQEQTINAAKRKFGRRTPQLASVEKLFKELRESSLEYGWLEELRDALQHGDINAFRYNFTAELDCDPAVNVYMDRTYMLDFTKEARKKPWLKREELQELDSDPNVRDMIEAIRPLMRPLQDKLDDILYPNVGEDSATVRELIRRFEGREGMYAVQTGPGFTRRKFMPPMFRLGPRVLHYAQFVYTSQDGVTIKPQISRLGAHAAMLLAGS